LAAREGRAPYTALWMEPLSPFDSLVARGVGC
jgi:hypothetical protein